MALNYFEVSKGVAIHNDATGITIVVSQGPGTTAISGVGSTVLPVGSIHIDTTTGKMYRREGTSGVGVADWEQGANQSAIDALVSGISWKDPVIARDDTSYADTEAAQAAFAAVGFQIDGLALVEDGRYLLSNLTSDPDNIYVANETIQTSGTLIIGQTYIISGYLTGDDFSNVGGPASAANGTHDGVVFTATGTTPTSYAAGTTLTSWTLTAEPGPVDGNTVWVQDGTSADEIWVYSGSAWVRRGSGDQVELAFIRTFIGKTASGSETPTYSSTTNVSSGTSLETAIGAVDAAIGTRTYTEDNVVTDNQSVASSVDALDIAVKFGKFGYVEQNKASNQPLSSTVVANATIGAATAAEVKWMVMIRETAAPATQEAIEVHAMITSGGVVDFSEYAKLKGTSKVAGLVFDVSLTGGELELKVTTTSNCDYVVQRTHTLQF